MKFIGLLFAFLFLQDAPICDPGRDDGIIDCFRKDLLSDWTTELSSEEIPYYGREGIRAPLIWGARSPKGSFIFLTVVNNTIQRPALSPEDLDALVTEESYEVFSPLGFEKGVTPLGTGDEEKSVFSISFSGESIGDPQDENLRKRLRMMKVYLPLVLRRGAGLEPNNFRNLLLIINYRGIPEEGTDEKAFERFVQSFRLPSGEYRSFDLQSFNRFQPELAQLTSDTRSHSVSGPASPKAPPEPVSEPIDEPKVKGPNWQPEAVAKVLLGGDQGEIEQLSQVFREGVLARLTQAILRRQRLEAERRTWDQLWGQATPQQRSFLFSSALVAVLDSLDRSTVSEVEAQSWLLHIFEKPLGEGLRGSFLQERDLNSFLRLSPKLWSFRQVRNKLRTFLDHEEASLKLRLIGVLEGDSRIPRLSRIARQDRDGEWSPIGASLAVKRHLVLLSKTELGILVPGRKRRFKLDRNVDVIAVLELLAEGASGPE